jgi:hypothetical protein
MVFVFDSLLDVVTFDKAGSLGAMVSKFNA